MKKDLKYEIKIVKGSMKYNVEKTFWILKNETTFFQPNSPDDDPTNWSNIYLTLFMFKYMYNNIFILFIYNLFRLI